MRRSSGMVDAPVIALGDPAFDQDRYGTIEALRRLSHYARTPQGDVIFLNRAEVAEVFACRDFRFYFDTIDDQRSPYLARAIQHELLNMHGDQHARLSRLVKSALRDRIVEGLRETITGIVDDLIDAMGDSPDFCADFADPLPARILGPMFGVPYDEVSGFNDWIKVGGRKLDALQTGVGIEAVEDANRNMHDFLRQLVRARRGAPGDDLFSELMQAEIDGDRMSEDELVYLTTELASAGVDTTRTQLPLILLALIQHPDQMAHLRADPSLALRAVDEGMRYAPLPWAIPHMAIHDCRVGGVDFAAGERVFVLVPAANRDPDLGPEMQTFDITRDRVRNFGFGAGMHACPGAQLARMEMSIALDRLITRMPSIRLRGAPDWVPGHKHRALATMRLELG